MRRNQMAISKKQARAIASLINTTNVWHIAVRDEVAKQDTMDTSKVRFFMERHDEAAHELNAILGVVAVTTYDREAV